MNQDYDFVAWLVLSPISSAIVYYFDYLSGKKYSINVSAAAALVNIIFYLSVAYYLKG